MGEISLDASSVSRFIVSLSKSIQALCHGCMDFDDSIEMIGYININIDSGKTLDCVLNEKVRKSAANSMTCISNSFQAKKEKPKQTKDSSCSPIPPREYPSHHAAHKRQYDRGSGRGDYIQRGSARKKFRHHPQPVLPSYSEQLYSSSLDTSYHEQPATALSQFIEPQPSVKTEVHDSASQQYDNSASTPSEQFLVKQEEQSDLPVTETNTGIHESNKNVDNSAHPSERQSFNVSNQPSSSHTSNAGQSSESSKQDQKNIDNENDEGESSFLGSEYSEAENYQESSQMAEDNQQPHCSQEEDPGGDDGFDVIEIGDDDEDVHNFFEPAVQQGNSQFVLERSRFSKAKLGKLCKERLKLKKIDRISSHYSKHKKETAVLSPVETMQVEEKRYRARMAVEKGEANVKNCWKSNSSQPSEKTTANRPGDPALYSYKYI